MRQSADAAVARSHPFEAQMRNGAAEESFVELQDFRSEDDLIDFEVGIGEFGVQRVIFLGAGDTILQRVASVDQAFGIKSP